MSTNNNDLTIYSAQIAIDPKSFKSQTLYHFALRINAAREAAAKVVLNAAADAKLARDKFEREAGKVLSEVQDSGSYKADGYKGAADFAAAVFGLNKSDCSSYIRAHKMRGIYPELDAMPRTNIDRLTAADAKSVKEAIANKELTPDSTQEKLKLFVADHPAKSKPAKVVPTFDLYTIGSDKPFSVSVAEADFIEVLHFGTAILRVPKSSPARYIAYDEYGTCQMFEARPHVTTKGKAAKVDRAARMNELLEELRTGKLTYDEFSEAMKALA